jgi:hypothetical protein
VGVHLKMLNPVAAGFDFTNPKAVEALLMPNDRPTRLFDFYLSLARRIDLMPFHLRFPTETGRGRVRASLRGGVWVVPVKELAVRDPDGTNLITTAAGESGINPHRLPNIALTIQGDGKIRGRSGEVVRLIQATEPVLLSLEQIGYRQPDAARIALEGGVRPTPPPAQPAPRATWSVRALEMMSG